MTNDNAKLVFTTESNNKINKEFFHREVVESASDAKTEMAKSIVELNKSRRRIVMPAPTKATTGAREESLKNRLAIGERIVKEIFKKPISFQTIIGVFYQKDELTKTNQKFIRNILGQIRAATKNVIYYHKDENVWRIDPNYRSGLPELVEAWHKNYGDLWRNRTVKPKSKKQSNFSDSLKAVLEKEKGEIDFSTDKNPELIINCGGTIVTINKTRITIDIG